MILGALYKNPFSEYHANQIDIDSLIEYWCDPFELFTKSGLHERDVYQENGALVFMGGRGSGKTMFLRQASVEVQYARYKKYCDKQETFIDYLNELGGVGIYIRFDGAGENISLKDYLKKEKTEITVEIRSRDTPQQNGKTERALATAWCRRRAVLDAAKFPKTLRDKLWGYT